MTRDLLDNSDYSTRQGAEMLAEMVRDHWRRQGIAVQARVEGIVDVRRPDRTIFVVVSDMKNGLPVRPKKEKREECSYEA